DFERVDSLRHKTEVIAGSRCPGKVSADHHARDFRDDGRIVRAGYYGVGRVAESVEGHVLDADGDAAGRPVFGHFDRADLRIDVQRDKVRVVAGEDVGERDIPAH